MLKPIHLKIVISSILICTFTACDLFLGEITDFPNQFIVDGTYSNPSGANPSFVVDPSSDQEVFISPMEDGKYVYTNIAGVDFNNIRFKDRLGAYELNKIETQTLVNDAWQKELEFKAFHDRPNEMDVFFVLDFSSSWQSTRSQYTKLIFDFMDSIKTYRQGGDSTRFGILTFHSSFSLLNPTRDSVAISNFIHSIPMGGGTRLYEAINRGVDVIEANAQPNQASVIVTITDGINNSFSDSAFATTDTLLERLFINKLTKRGLITHYVLGFDRGGGTINEYDLKSITTGDGHFAAVDSYEGMEFQLGKMAKYISFVYNIKYQRDRTQVSAIPIRFKLETTLH